MRGTCLARAFTAAAAALIFAATAPAFAQESLDVGPVHIDLQNAAETDWALSTASKNNPGNNNGLSCPNHDAPGCGVSTNGNTFNLAAFRYDGLLNGRVSSDVANELGLDNLDFFVHARFWSDITPFVDGNMPQIPQMKYGQRFRGDGWTATVAQNEFMLDPAEAYIDLRKGPLWVRAGKQQIVYGEELGFQVLDQVDSLDLRRHSLFNYAGLEFSDARMAPWTIRATYDLGDIFARAGITRTRVTGWFGQFNPDVLIPPGSPYGSGAANILFVDNGYTPRAQHRPSYGAVAEWSVGPFDMSFNFYSHPQALGDLKFAGIQFDRFQGAPIFGPGFGYWDILLSRYYPREFIYGGMASYMIQPIYTFPGADILNGDIVRVSGTYTPNKTFTYTPPSGALVTKRLGEINVALDVEKNYRWTAKLPSMFILAEYNYRSASNLFDTYWRNTGNHMFNLFLLSLTQPLPLARWSLSNVTEAEPNGNWSWFDQPGVVFKPSSSQEYDVFWNFATGNALSQFGASRFSDEIVAKAIYKF